MKPGLLKIGLLVQSVAVILIITLSLSGAADTAGSSWILLLWGLIFFTVFYFVGQKVRPIPSADAVTGVRLIMGMVFFLMAALSALSPLTALILAFLIEFADGLDGWLARRAGTTEFGGIWDMESDAFIILLMSVGAYWYTGQPIWVLIPGVIRYVFFFPFLVLKPEAVKFPVILSWFSKTICVASVFCLASAWYLPDAATTAIAIVSILITVSFSWETVYYIYLRIQAR